MLCSFRQSVCKALFYLELTLFQPIHINILWFPNGQINLFFSHQHSPQMTLYIIECNSCMWHSEIGVISIQKNIQSISVSWYISLTLFCFSQQTIYTVGYILFLQWHFLTLSSILKLIFKNSVAINMSTPRRILWKRIITGFILKK